MWQGQYRIDLALELENNRQEFTLHMRGLLDFNAAHRVGMFYAPKPPIEEAGVGVGPNEEIRLAEWKPPWMLDNNGVALEDARPLVAVFLSEKKPEVLGARRYTPPDHHAEVIAW